MNADKPEPGISNLLIWCFLMVAGSKLPVLVAS
jgi:hypothetical protein